MRWLIALCALLWVSFLTGAIYICYKDIACMDAGGVPSLTPHGYECYIFKRTEGVKA